MTFYHVFSSWLSIKVKQSSCFFFMFLFMFLFMFFFMFLVMFLFMFLFMFLIMTLYQTIFMFFFMTFYQKIMQKSKIGKFSIFSSLDVKLKFLTNRVKLIQFSVELNCIKLKIWAIWLKLSWKCEQFNSILIWIQNVNSKLDLMISLTLTKLF